MGGPWVVRTKSGLGWVSLDHAGRWTYTIYMPEAAEVSPVLTDLRRKVKPRRRTVDGGRSRG